MFFDFSLETQLVFHFVQVKLYEVYFTPILKATFYCFLHYRTFFSQRNLKVFSANRKIAKEKETFRIPVYGRELFSMKI
jgi:hypothetical protein